MFKIGDVEVKNRVVLAPMAGVCNSAFRRIIKEMGCGLLYAEMVSDKAIVYDNEKTKNMLYMTEEERPIAQQIFGSDKDSFVKAAKIIEESMHPDIIDINMGCPVPKVAVKSQAGSALLKNPDKIYEIVKAVKEAVNVPVTVKIILFHFFLPKRYYFGSRLYLPHNSTSLVLHNNYNTFLDNVSIYSCIVLVNSSLVLI